MWGFMSFRPSAISKQYKNSPRFIQSYIKYSQISNLLLNYRMQRSKSVFRRNGRQKALFKTVGKISRKFCLLVNCTRSFRPKENRDCIKRLKFSLGVKKFKKLHANHTSCLVLFFPFRKVFVLCIMSFVNQTLASF